MSVKPITPFLLLASAMIFTSGTKAQLSPYFEPWKPIYTHRTTPIFFDSNSKTIRLPAVDTLSQPNREQQTFYNVILKEIADGQFEVESYVDPNTTLICSETKTLAAVPNLSFDLSFREANELIGCYGQIDEFEVDDDLGKLITATWPNGLGVEFQFPVYGPGAYSGIRPARISNSSITLSFREGEVVSYVVAKASPTGQCSEQVLETAFESLTLGMNYEDVVALSGCDGAVTSLLVDARGERQRVVWYEQIQPFVPVIDIVSREEAENHILTIDFFGGVAEQLNLFSTPVPDVSNGYCSLEILTNAYDSLSIGDFESDFGVLNSCPASYKDINIRDGVTRKTVSWLFVEQLREVFFARGHELTISTVDDKVVEIDFFRI